MGPVCPSCGVAVVPGYVKCPKCHTALPYRRAGSTSLGGTSMLKEEPERGFPLGIVALAIALVVIDVYWTVRDDRVPHAEPPAPVIVEPTQPDVTPTAPQTAPVTPPTTPRPAAPNAPNADTTAAALEADLKRQELWSTVGIVGNHVDIRSSSCSTPAMTKTVANAVAAFKAAGVTRLRCLEDSGTIVIDRNL